jgi:hypothetical protein
LPRALPSDGQGGSLDEITCEYSSELDDLIFFAARKRDS